MAQSLEHATKLLCSLMGLAIIITTSIESVIDIYLFLAMVLQLRNCHHYNA